jgi:hypothetical protein
MAEIARADVHRQPARPTRHIGRIGGLVVHGSMFRLSCPRDIVASSRLPLGWHYPDAQIDSHRQAQQTHSDITMVSATDILAQGDPVKWISTNTIRLQVGHSQTASFPRV